MFYKRRCAEKDAPPELENGSATEHQQSKLSSKTEEKPRAAKRSRAPLVKAIENDKHQTDGGDMASVRWAVEKIMQYPEAKSFSEPVDWKALCFCSLGC